MSCGPCPLCIYLCICIFTTLSTKSLNEHNRRSLKNIQNLKGPHLKILVHLPTSDTIMAQNVSVSAFGDSFLARQENHSHYLGCARHVFSLRARAFSSLLCSTSTSIPLYQMIPHPQENYPGWKLAGVVGG